VIATGNPGCAIQLAASLRRLGRADIPIVHPVELLAGSGKARS
jgi:Fe-S oxidoreductase